jgi:hypothetical protein
MHCFCRRNDEGTVVFNDSALDHFYRVRVEQLVDQPLCRPSAAFTPVARPHEGAKAERRDAAPARAAGAAASQPKRLKTLRVTALHARARVRCRR